MIYFVIKNRAQNIANMDQEQKEKYLGNMTYLLIFVAFMIFLSGLYIIIRSFTISTNDQIGLYDDSEQNSFESNIAVNYIIDIIEIVLYGIEVCFIIRLKRGITAQFSTPVNNQVLPSINHIRNVPQPSQNPYQMSRPQQIEVRQVRVTKQIVSIQRMHPLDDYV